MDFVQRNLINERNNLQIELAKAKLLIAELSEATNYNNSPNKDVKSNLSNFEKGQQANNKPRPLRNEITHNPSNKPKPTNEEAEYISDLENVIISIAEQLGVHPNDLLNELNVGGAIKSGYQAGGVIGAIKGAVRGVGVNMRQAGNSILPASGNQRLAGVAKKAGEGAQIAARNIERTLQAQSRSDAKQSLGMRPANTGEHPAGSDGYGEESREEMTNRRKASVGRNLRAIDRAVTTGDRVTNVAKTFAGQNRAQRGFDAGRFSTRTLTDRHGGEHDYNASERG
jgi:hypothetical protein